MDMDWIKICREGIRKAADEVMKLYHSPDKRGKEITRGKGGDMTLLADKASEDIVIGRLRDLRRDIRIISEECGEITIGKRPQNTILLDPLDGSFNFKNGFPYFGISMAVLDQEDRPVAGYILDLPQGEEYYANAEGAFRSDKKIRSSRVGNADRVLLELTKGISSEDLEIISRTLLKMRHTRCPGAVALDLCRVADGTFDCLLYAGASRYLDVAAGIYILEKAGGLVSNFSGSRNIRQGIELKSRNLLAAGNRDIQTQVLTFSP